MLIYDSNFSFVLYKEIKLALLLATLGCVALLFAGCGLSRLSDGPSADDVVSGNGSLAVQKGDYLYFVNGYRNTSDIGDSNHYGNVDQSAIYRVKLDSEGRVTEAEKQYDEDGEEIFDKTQSLQNIDILVPLVAGFEYTKLFIFGDYLYYATPNNLRDGSGTIMSDYLHIYRVSLDRSGGNDLVYSSESETANVTWTMHQVGETVYMTILDGNHLSIVFINGGNYQVNHISNDVSSASMPYYPRSDISVKEIDKSIYFTTTVEDDDNTTILKRYNLADKITTEVFSSTGEKYEIKGTNGNKLYYTKTISLQPGFSAKVYALDTSNNETIISNQSVGDSADITAYALTDPTQEMGILYTDGTNTYYKLASANSATQVIDSNIISNILCVQGEYVYYLADSSLYKIKYTEPNQSREALIPSGVTAKGDIVNNFSVNGDKVYFFVQYSENYYMHYVDYGIQTSVTDSSAYTHFVGKLLEVDYVSESSESE